MTSSGPTPESSGIDPSWMVLFNPAARRGAHVAREVRQRLESEPSPPGGTYEFVALEELERIRDFRPERLLVIGGDGTINQAAQWLLRQEHACPLALIPGGTGNNLITGLGLPGTVGAAVDLARAGRNTRRIDAVRYGSTDEPRVFLQSGAFGFAADVAGRYDSLRKRTLFRLAARPLGANVYLLLAWLGLRELGQRTQAGRSLEVSIRLPGEEITERVAGIFLGNEKSLGGDFYPCPRAVLDDGQLDLCLVRAAPGVSYRKVFQEVRRGEHLSREDLVLYRQTPGPAELTFSEEVAFLSDGDLRDTGREFVFELLPRRFDIVVG